jgi:hypothetical protein
VPELLVGPWPAQAPRGGGGAKCSGRSRKAEQKSGKKETESALAKHHFGARRFLKIRLVLQIIARRSK